MRISWLLFFTVMAFPILAAKAGELRQPPPYAMVATHPSSGETSDILGKRLTKTLAEQKITPVFVEAESVVQILVPADRAEDARRLLAKAFDAETLTLQHIVRKNIRGYKGGSVFKEYSEQQIIGLPVVSTRNDRANAATIARIDELFREHKMGMRGFSSAAVNWHAPVADWARARKIISDAIEAEKLPAQLIVLRRLDR